MEHFKILDFIPSNDESISFEEGLFREDGLFTDQQEIIGRFINKESPIKMLLLVHEMGTGKTCTASKIIETLLDDNYDRRSHIRINNRMKMIYVVVPSEKHSELFQSTIQDVCVPKQFAEELRCELSSTMKKMIQFVSYSDFNKICAQNAKRFESTGFIFDEIHTQTADKLDVFSSFLKNVDDKVLIAMSGTPMIDQDRQLLKIFNFMRASFKMPIFGPDHSITSAIEEMKNNISYLKNSGDVVINICTNRPKMGKYWKCEMSDFQRNVVMKLLLSELNYDCNNDATKTAFYNDVIQASCFVFPDGSFGKNGFETFVKENQRNAERNFTLRNPELFTSIGRCGTKFEEAMKLVDEAHQKGQCSFVFSMFVKGSGLVLFSLLLQKFLKFEPVTDVSRVLETKKKRFLLVTGTTTGVNDALAKFNHPSNSSGEYISCILGSTSMTEGYSLNHIRNVIFLTPEWNFSSIYQIIYRGMRMNSHQFITNWDKVLDVYILDAFTLAKLEEKKKCESRTRLKVLFEDSYVSFDMAMLNRAEEKDIPIQSAMYLMKVNAVDCELMRRFNVMDERFSNTRQTENMPCDYGCVNTLPRDGHRNRILRYGVLPGLRTFIIDFFSSQNEMRRFHISVHDLFSKVKETFPDVTFQEFMKTVRELIFKNVQMGTFLGQPRFITNFNDCIITTHDLVPVNPKTHFFKKSVPLIKKTGFPELAFDIEIFEAEQKLCSIFFHRDVVAVCKQYGALGIHSENVRNEFLKKLSPTDMEHLIHKIGMKMQADWMQMKFTFPSLTNNENVLYRYLSRVLVISTFEGNEYFSIFLRENKPQMICLTMQLPWVKCHQSIVENFFKDKQKVTRACFERSFGLSFIGSRSLTRDSFCIRKRSKQISTDKRMIQVGKQIESFNPSELEIMYLELFFQEFNEDVMLIDVARKQISSNFIFPENEQTFESFKQQLKANNPGNIIDEELKRIEFPTRKKYLETKIKNELLNRDLVVSDQSCGTQNKMRS